MKIPDMIILNQNGESIKLNSLKGQKIIFFFYPKDDTPGCTIEGIDFSNLLPKFKKLNYAVYGISRDSVKSHQKFCDKFNFKFDLLSDEDEELCKYFDVIKEKNMYGKKVFGIERSTFIFDEKLKLISEYRKVKAEGHAQFILDEIKKLD
ncbi:MAG: peroxiredoxin [Moraxellaceae bacterium]|nr:peroxiredoxin [Pseudobdellovibrionaceae bacterium]